MKALLARQQALFEADDARRAALNLMEDAIAARSATDKLSAILRESEQRYRILSTIVTDISWTADPQGRFVTMQPEWTQYTGQSWHACRDRGWLDAVHAEDREPLCKAIKQVFATASGNFATSGRLWHAASATFRYCTLRATPIRDHEGTVREWVGACTDVHDRWVANEALRLSEERFRALSDNMAQLASITNAEGEIEWINKRWRDFAVDRTELLGSKGWKEFLHPDHRERIVKKRARALRSGLPWEDTFPMWRAADGSYRWFLHRSEPMHDESGTAVRWFDTSTDVTEQLMLERQIQEQADQLAEESHRKDAFLAMLSHELRNPLASIHSALHVLETRSIGEEASVQRQALAVIERQAKNLTVLVNDLLEVSRMISHRVRLDRQVIDLNELLRHAFEAARSAADAHHLQLTLALCDDAVWVSVDASRIEEIVANLLDNAIKFTEAGGRIELHCERDDAASVARIRVRDTGVGIDPALLPGMFEFFTQADQSLARTEGGMGIGLALARRLATLHGGTLEGHSPPQGADHGSEFIVTLPQVSAPAVETVGRADASPRSPLSALKVLVVDDNIDQVTMLASALEHEGLQVRTARTGEAALAEAASWHPDVALLDIGLPGIDGHEVARRMRANPDLCGTRLIAVSGYARRADIARSLEAGFEAHLGKPAEHSRIMKLIESSVHAQPKSSVGGH